MQGERKTTREKKRNRNRRMKKASECQIKRKAKREVNNILECNTQKSIKRENELNWKLEIAKKQQQQKEGDLEKTDY